MCGIAGIISYNPAYANAERIKKMTDILAHRGPDGEGYWNNPEGTVVLGHRRLSIIDLSNAGKQPMHYPYPSAAGTGSRYTIVHNGEIYNYPELKEELQKRGYFFHSKTDTEIIAAAYDLWKEECMNHFDGMFAFAIWDEKEKELFAVRDRFGEKPFFYFIDKEQFIFASEMKALWAAGINRKPNLKMLFNFLTIGYTLNPGKEEETFFEDIRKLPAASCLKYSLFKNEHVVFKYWDIETKIQNEQISDEEAVEQFRFLFQQSITRRLRSDVSLGIGLSGGIDSSSVVAVINHIDGVKKNKALHSSNLSAFTAVFPGFEKDESLFSQMVAAKFHLQHYTVESEISSILSCLETIFYHQEEPLASASTLAQFKVFELAKNKGVKVLLDGQGSDEILAGYYKYYKWYWQELFRKGELSASQELSAARKLGINENFGWKNKFAALFPRYAAIFLKRNYLWNTMHHGDLTNDFIRLQNKEIYYHTPEIFSLNGVLYFNTCRLGLEELLRYADRNSMACGREVRLPFLSHELVEFVFSLPAHLKIRNGWTKWLLRKAMDKELPSQIVWRRDKTGFEPPQKQWMQNSKIQELILLAKQKLVKEKIIKPQVLNKNIRPTAAYVADNFDWRYLTSSYLFR